MLWGAPHEGGGIAPSNYSLLSLPSYYSPSPSPPSPHSHRPPRHIALARRRVGRGGRWDNITCGCETDGDNVTLGQVGIMWSVAVVQWWCVGAAMAMFCCNGVARAVV